MKIYVVVANQEYESSEMVIGVFSTLEKANEAKASEQVKKKYDYSTVFECDIDNTETVKVIYD